MADVNVTAANVLKGAGAITAQGTAGATITAGQPVYGDAADSGDLKLCSTASEAAADCVGVSLCGAADGQPLVYIRSGPLTAGGTLAVGMVYAVSDNAGGIAPIGDVSTGDYVTTLGTATSATVLEVDVNVSDTVSA